MEMPSLSEEEFQLQFSNLDQDKDGLISFDDFKVYIMLNASGGSSTASDQLTIEEISYMNQLYDQNKSQTVSQMKKVAKSQGMLEVFAKFFQGYEYETIDDAIFTDRVESFENSIFGISETDTKQKPNLVKNKTATNLGQDKSLQNSQKIQTTQGGRGASQVSDLSLSSRSREASGITNLKTQSEQVVGICIGYLTEADNAQQPENKIQDVFNLLLDNPSSISQQDWPIFISNLANVHKQVLSRITDFEDQTQKLRRDFEEQLALTEDAKQQFKDCKSILTGMEADYLQMQKQIGEILPKYQMLTQLNQRNAMLTTQLYERNNEISKLKSELFSSQQAERDFKIKLEEIEEKLLDAETEVRQVRQQLKDGGAVTPGTRRMSKFDKRGTLAFGQNRKTQMQSFFAKKLTDSDDRDQSVVDNQDLIDQEELTEALEQNYLKQLAILTNSQKLSSIERQSLQSIIQQYESYKQSWATAMEEAEEAAQELENLEETVQKLTEEVEYQKKISADDRKQLELTKAQLEQVKNERDQLLSEVETLQLELIQGDLFAKAGLGGEWAKIKGDGRKGEIDEGVENRQSNKPANKLEELQSMNLQNYETVDELNFARASQFKDDFIQNDGRETWAPTGKYFGGANKGGLDQIQEIEEYRESGALSVQQNEQEQDYYEEAEQDQFADQEKDAMVFDQLDGVEIEANQAATSQYQSFVSAKEPQLEFQSSTQTVFYSQYDEGEPDVADKSGEPAEDAEEFNPTQDEDVPEVEETSGIRQTAVRLTNQSARVTESSRRITMRQEEIKSARVETTTNPHPDIENEVLNKSNDSDEYGDQVGSLPGERVRNENFDSVLESKGDLKPERTISPPRQYKEPERLGSTVKDLMNRSKDFINMRQSTLLKTSSNRKDFDYLNIRRVDHKQFARVDRILQDHYEGNSFAVFSDNIQQFDSQLKVNNRIVIITSQSIFILDKRFQFVKRELIRDLSDVILIKTNASIFSLNFVTGPPLLFQTFRRTELTVFLLTQGENMKKKANILRSKGLKITLRSGKSQQLYFDKQDTLKTSDSYQTKLLKNLQLNNFVNSLMCGYIEKMDYNFLGSIRWEEKFFVLTNVGLLYFADPLKAPSDLFPVLDCEIKKLVRGDEGYTTGYEALRLVYSRKTIIFRCLSVSDYDQWFKAIMTLQSQSEEKRQELKISEDRRLTTIARGLGVQVLK